MHDLPPHKGFDAALMALERSASGPQGGGHVANGHSLSEAASLQNLPFTDLYIRIDGRGPSRYKIGANDKNLSGILPLPEKYEMAIEHLRGVIGKMPLDEGAVTMDTMRLRYCRATVMDGETWASLRRIPLDLPFLGGLFMHEGATKLIGSWSQRRGIVLVGGATGAGKTTTAVAAVASYLERRSEVAVTIEDPPEYFLQGEVGKGFCFQFEVNGESDWSDKVKAALRWRPRYILIGEIRTPDAAAQALRASTSGHLVISTVHGGSVAETLGAVLRLAEASLGASAKALLADNLVGVIHQRLNSYGPDLYIAQTETGPRRDDEVRKAILSASLGNIKADPYLAPRD